MRTPILAYPFPNHNASYRGTFAPWPIAPGWWWLAASRLSSSENEYVNACPSHSSFPSKSARKGSMGKKLSVGIRMPRGASGVLVHSKPHHASSLGKEEEEEDTNFRICFVDTFFKVVCPFVSAGARRGCRPRAEIAAGSGRRRAAGAEVTFFLRAEFGIWAIYCPVQNARPTEHHHHHPPRRRNAIPGEPGVDYPIYSIDILQQLNNRNRNNRRRPGGKSSNNQQQAQQQPQEPRDGRQGANNRNFQVRNKKLCYFYNCFAINL